MPRLQIELSEKEINDLIDGKKISLGEQKEYSDVYLVKEENEKVSVKKEANDYMFFIDGKEIGIVNNKGDSYYSKGLEHGHKPKAKKPSKDLTSLYYDGEKFIYLCPGYKCYLTNKPLDDSVGEDGDLNMFGHGNCLKVNGKWEYCNLKNGINKKSMNQFEKWKDYIMFGNDSND